MFGFFKKKKGPPPTGPDFSHIDSQAKAEALFRRGDLEKLLLMPEAFGGEDSPLNTLYVPVGVAGVKAGIDATTIVTGHGGPLHVTGRGTLGSGQRGQSRHADEDSC